MECETVLETEFDGVLRLGRILNNRTLFGKYPDRLPSDGSLAGVEGGTPLIEADRLASSVGTDATIYLKDERRNPTGSFKDRAFAPMLSAAAESGEDRILTASTGNAATACAHYAARGNLTCLLLVDGDTPDEKLLEPSLYGAEIVRVDGLFDASATAFESFLESVADRLEAYLAVAHQPLSPLSMEGVKTISFEVAEQLEWTAPDVVVTPVGGGDNIVAQYKGYRELRSANLLDRLPRMVGVQASGAAPLVESIERGTDEPVEVEPETIASGIDAAFSGRHALETVRESGGTAVAVSDEEILAGERELAQRTGVWAEPAAASVVPALERLVSDGVVGDDDTVVLTVTGSGHKHVGPVEDAVDDVDTVAFDATAVTESLY
ncbi:threonine synthase [Natrarchaeobius oligotrophus]|nr:threonine synthase [Natrarchaeobius chitinivorans]